MRSFTGRRLERGAARAARPTGGAHRLTVYLQLAGSDGAGTHALATLGGLIFDSAESCALPLSHARALDRCDGRVHLIACGARCAIGVSGKSVVRWVRWGAR